MRRALGATSYVECFELTVQVLTAAVVGVEHSAVKHHKSVKDRSERTKRTTSIVDGKSVGMRT